MKAGNWKEFICHFFLTLVHKYHFLAEPPIYYILNNHYIPLNLCLFLLEQSCLSKSVEESFCLVLFCVYIKTPAEPYSQRRLYVSVQSCGSFSLGITVAVFLK